MKDFTIVRKGFDTTEVDSYIVDLENTLEKDQVYFIISKKPQINMENK